MKLFNFQMFQKYISRIKPETLQRVLIEINKIDITEGLFIQSTSLTGLNVGLQVIQVSLFTCHSL